MAIVVPILSEFNDRGIKQANQGFKDLEGFGKKNSICNPQSSNTGHRRNCRPSSSHIRCCQIRYRR